jgi:hypothetical protein
VPESACRTLVERTCNLVGQQAEQCRLMRENVAMLSDRHCAEALDAMRVALGDLPDEAPQPSAGTRADCRQLSRYACEMLRDERQCAQVRKAMEAMPVDQCTQAVDQLHQAYRLLGR